MSRPLLAFDARCACGTHDVGWLSWQNPMDGAPAAGVRWESAVTVPVCAPDGNGSGKPLEASRTAEPLPPRVPVTPLGPLKAEAADWASRTLAGLTGGWRVS